MIVNVKYVILANINIISTFCAKYEVLKVKLVKNSYQKFFKVMFMNYRLKKFFYYKCKFNSFLSFYLTYLYK